VIPKFVNSEADLPLFQADQAVTDPTPHNPQSQNAYLCHPLEYRIVKIARQMKTVINETLLTITKAVEDR